MSNIDVYEMIPNVWISDAHINKINKFINDKKIEYVINTTEQETILNNKIKYLEVNMNMQNICINSLIAIFKQTNNFIFEAIQNKSKLLIYGNKDYANSMIIIGAFLIRHADLDYIRTINYINSVKKVIIHDTCLVRGLNKYYIYVKSPPNIKSQVIHDDNNCHYCDDLLK